MNFTLSSRYDSDDMIVYSPEGSSAVDDDDEEASSDYKPFDTFLQRENCFATSQLLPQCYECENDPMTNKYTCRFYEFRKIERNNGKYKVAGFLDKHIDPSVEDLDLWTTADSKLEVDKETADYILTFIAPQFCELAKEEAKISKSHDKESCAWKRSVLQVREICDVCDTSLFNFHWTCTHCGTCVCLDCNKERQSRISRWKPVTKVDKEERDSFFWLKCHSRSDHDMMLTQITTGDALKFLDENLHKICEQRNITQRCGCSLRTKNCVKMVSKNILLEHSQRDKPSELRQIMKRQRHKARPARRMSLLEQQQVYKKVKTFYISQGRILKIIEPSESSDHYKIFQDQWEQGKPVVVANVTQKMRKFIWTPEYFTMHFGNEKHAMINCQNDVDIKQVSMKYFWDGFGSIKRRLPRDCEEKLVLKLKDWPTSNDFADVMKEHFDEAMKAVPLACYTNRDGKYNLARYLPSHFSRPDLGPKMYSAYSQIHPSRQGSTNLHLDVSDAVNVMVRVSKPIDAHLAPNQYSIQAILVALEAAGADEYDKNLLIKEKALPGAIWHIWPAQQADEIRKLLHTVAKENGKPLGVNDDAIHDQVSLKVH
jgi:[histone H3]-dimethyl-L-lysine9 demethylase